MHVLVSPDLVHAAQGKWIFEEPRQEKLWYQATTISVSNKSPFTFDPRMSHLLPATVKLQQANILACKLHKSTDPSQLLTRRNHHRNRKKKVT